MADDTETPNESAHEALTVAIAHAMLQITHIVGAKEAHEDLKAALHAFDPEQMPEAYREPHEAEETKLLEHGDSGDEQS